MTFEEIVNAIPHLSLEQRRELCCLIIELEDEEMDMMMTAYMSAAQASAMLDQMEAEDEAKASLPSR